MRTSCCTRRDRWTTPPWIACWVGSSRSCTPAPRAVRVPRGERAATRRDRGRDTARRRTVSLANRVALLHLDIHLRTRRRERGAGGFDQRDLLHREQFVGGARGPRVDVAGR